jgi:hypothetical protein
MKDAGARKLALFQDVPTARREFADNLLPVRWRCRGYYQPQSMGEAARGPIQQGKRRPQMSKIIRILPVIADNGFARLLACQHVSRRSRAVGPLPRKEQALHGPAEGSQHQEREYDRTEIGANA